MVGSPPAPAPPESDVLRPYVRAVRRHPVFVVLFVLGSILGGVAIVVTRSPTYTARARLLVTPVERGEAGDLGLPLLQEHGDPTRTIETAAAVVENRDVAGAAAADLGGRRTAADVLEAVDVSPQGQTNVLDVRAIADDPETAAALANAYANAVIEVRGDAVRQAADEAIGAIQADLASSDTMSSSTVDALESRLSEIELMRVIGDPTVAVAEAAEVPLSPDGSPTFLVIITGLLVGVILAPGAALIVDRLGRRRRLMEEDELAEVHPLAVLARVPLRRRKVPSTRIDPNARDSLRGLCTQLDLARPRPRTIMITSPSEDDGRTWVALNLAAELADAGTSNVVLIDLDDKLVSDTEIGLVAESGEIAGFSRYQLRSRPSLVVLGRHHAEKDTDHVVEPALQAIGQFAGAADSIVLDAPLLGEVADALRLAAVVDALILVVRLGFTTLEDLGAACTQLDSIGIPPTGYVVIGAAGR
jgi:tyrosine-protein kinase